jgi:hypothetical protein
MARPTAPRSHQCDGNPASTTAAAGLSAPVDSQPSANRTGERGRSSPRRPERQPPTAKIEDLERAAGNRRPGRQSRFRARITSHLSLPGRFLVYMPTVDHIGVSRKIESREERRRLRTIVQRFREQSGLPGGVIIRTAASNRSEEDLTTDLTYFQQIWNEIQRRRESERTPAVLFREESLVTKLLRDLLNEQFTAIRIDDETSAAGDGPDNRIMPNMAGRVKRYEGLSDLRRMRRAGQDRQGAAQQGHNSRAAGISSSIRPKRSSRSTSNTGATSARRPPGVSKTPSSRLILKLRVVCGKSVCATWAASSSSTSSTWRTRRTGKSRAVGRADCARTARPRGRAGRRLRADHHHAQAREESLERTLTEPCHTARAAHDQDEFHDLLRHLPGRR